MFKSLKKLFVIVVLFFGFVSFLGGISFYVGLQRGKQVCKVCPPAEIDFSLFWEAYHKLKNSFIDKEKLNVEKIIYGAISGMTKSLEDPYTVFLTPEKAKRFEEDVSGSFEGIGVEIGIKRGQLQVIAPLEGTPAQKVGLRSGDKILKINETPTIDITLEEAVNLIRGPKGTKVILTIFREGWDETKEIEIKRNIINVPATKLEFKEVNGQKIAHLQIYHFTLGAEEQFKKNIFEILSTPTKKIILDLRNNPGGYLEEAKNIAGWFLKKGETIFIEEFVNGEKTEYKSKGAGILSDYKIVVLINEGTASGAEILAGALRDKGRILLVGTKTFGKGSVQRVEKLSNGSALKITSAKWLTPNGDLITDKGLEPDIRIETTLKNETEGKDPQLEKALEILKNF